MPTPATPPAPPRRRMAVGISLDQVTRAQLDAWSSELARLLPDGSPNVSAVIRVMVRVLTAAGWKPNQQVQVFQIEKRAAGFDAAQPVQPKGRGVAKPTTT